MKYTIVTESEGIKVLLIKIILSVMDIFISFMLIGSGMAYYKHNEEKYQKIVCGMSFIFIMLSLANSVALSAI